jgi:hypothetical protein
LLLESTHWDAIEEAVQETVIAADPINKSEPEDTAEDLGEAWIFDTEAWKPAQNSSEYDETDDVYEEYKPIDRNSKVPRWQQEIEGWTPRFARSIPAEFVQLKTRDFEAWPGKGQYIIGKWASSFMFLLFNIS